MKLFYVLFWKLRIYLIWSKLYRFLYHRKYDHIILQQGKLTPSEAMSKMIKLKWTKDGSRELLDAVGSPRWVQYCIDTVERNEPQPEGALDCDEFAAWAASVLETKYEAVALNVYWKTDFFTGDYSGHNVCLYLDSDGFHHIGNWGKSTNFANKFDLVQDVLKCGSSGKGTLVGWSEFDPISLKLVSTHKG